MRPAHLSSALATALLACAVLPASGAAKTICVSKPGCVGKVVATVNAAAAEANSSAGADRIEIGEGTFTGAAMYFGDMAAVDVVGAGRGKTILQTAGSAALTLSRADSSVSDLSVQIDDKSVLGIDLSGANTKAERVEVTGAGVETSASDIGIILRRGGTVRDAVVTMPLHPQYADYGISLSPSNAADPANVPTLIENVTVTSGYAVNIRPGNREVTVRGAQLKGGTFGVGIATPVPHVTLENVAASAFKRDEPNASANGVNVYGYDSAASATVVDLRHVTANAPHRGGRAFSVQQQGVTPLTINAVDSAFFGGRDTEAGSFDIELGGFKTGTQMHVSRSAYRSTNIWSPEWILQGPGYTKLHDDGGNVDLAGHPGQQLADLAAGDLRPVAGSVLVDNGTPGPLDPSASAVDAAGAPRLADGDGDGDVRRDLGAYEVAAGTNPGHVAAVAMGTLCQVTTCPKPGGGGGGGTTAKVLPDTKILKLMPKGSRKEISGTATGAVQNVLISITRKRGKKCEALSAKQKWVKTAKVKPAGTCAASFALVAKGQATWSLKLKKELPKGKYVVHVRATGPDGIEPDPTPTPFKR